MVLEQIANLSAVLNGFGVQVPGTPPKISRFSVCLKLSEKPQHHHTLVLLINL